MKPAPTPLEKKIHGLDVVLTPDYKFELVYKSKPIKDATFTGLANKVGKLIEAQRQEDQHNDQFEPMLLIKYDLWYDSMGEDHGPKPPTKVWAVGLRDQSASTYHTAWGLLIKENLDDPGDPQEGHYYNLYVYTDELWQEINTLYEKKLALHQEMVAVSKRKQDYRSVAEYYKVHRVKKLGMIAPALLKEALGLS